MSEDEKAGFVDGRWTLQCVQLTKGTWQKTCALHSYSRSFAICHCTELPVRLLAISFILNYIRPTQKLGVEESSQTYWRMFQDFWRDNTVIAVSASCVCFGSLLMCAVVLIRKKQRQVVYISQDGKKIPAHESKRYQVAPQPQVLKRSVTDSNVAAKAWDSPSHLSQAVKGGASKHDATWEVPAEHVVLFGDVYDLNEHFGDAEH